MATGFTLNHFHIGNKDIRYIVTAIGVGITIFALVQLSTDIGTALFGIEDINTINLNIIHNIYREKGER